MKTVLKKIVRFLDTPIVLGWILTILFVSMLFMNGCGEATYPSITGQIKQVTTATTPGHSNIHTAIIFIDGRQYLFLGQSPSLLEEGKIVRIYFDEYACSENCHYAKFIHIDYLDPTDIKATQKQEEK